MTDYTTRITASRNKIWDLNHELYLYLDTESSNICSRRASIYEMLANEYRELAKVLEDMEKKEINHDQPNQ